MALKTQMVRRILGLTYQLFPFFIPLITTYLLPSFSNAIAIRSLVLRNISITRMMASTTQSEITVKHRHLKMILRALKGLLNLEEKFEVTTYWKWAMSDWAAGRRWSLRGSRCRRWWHSCLFSHSGFCTPRSNARYLRDRRGERTESHRVCCGWNVQRIMGGDTMGSHRSR